LFLAINLIGWIGTLVWLAFANSVPSIAGNCLFSDTNTETEVELTEGDE
jgi:hypothetical protein